MEFLDLTKQADLLVEQFETQQRRREIRAKDLTGLNRAFIDYLNYGGYPEVVVDPLVRQDLQRFVGRDIVQKVLMHDPPSLYGIQDIQELNRLFTTIAYNTGQEISLEELSKNSGVTKNTISRYLEYLEAAFLITRVRRVDEKAQRFQRQRHFKVYLTNPSMRAALFGSVDNDSPHLGAVAETAVFAQWTHSPELPTLHYARWGKGEVDVVRIDPATGQPNWAYDVKWSDHHAEGRHDLRSLIEFAQACGVPHVGASTRTRTETVHLLGRELRLFPLALHCYRLALQLHWSLQV